MTRDLGPEIPPFEMDRFQFFKREKADYQPVPIITRTSRHLPFCFILGAKDPEMDEIEKLLKENGEAFQYAWHGKDRAEPWNSYIADPVAIPTETVAVLVECEPTTFEGEQSIIRAVDHHRPGDPGHDCPPEEFWEASSIGQVYKLLNSVRPDGDRLEPTREHFVLAALDHCPAQARLGKCPGIDPEEVRALSIEYTARRRGLSVMLVEATVAEMYHRIDGAPRTLIGAQEVIDLTSESVGLGYSLELLCMQEALISLGKVGLLRTKNRVGGSDKIIICGAVTPDTVRYFMKSWAPAHGLEYVYGVPARGYAGGYRD